MDLSFPANVFPPYGGESFQDGSYLRVFLQPVLQIAQKGRGIRRAVPIGERIVYPQTALAIGDQTGILENLQMLGHRGLRQPQGFLDLTHAHGLLLQQLHGLHPIWIRKRFHDFDEIFHEDLLAAKIPLPPFAKGVLGGF